MLTIGLNQRFELPNTHHPVLLSASRSLHQNVLQGRIWGFESGHSFPVHSPQDDDLSSNSANVDVGRRSKNTSFESTSNGNGRVKGIIASLERSSSSEDEDDDGGRRSNSLNKNQRHSMSYSPTKEQQHSASYSHSPNKTQRPLPSRGTVHDLFSFSAPSPGAGRGPSTNTREASDTRTEGEETIKSPHQARLLPYPPLLTPVHTGSGSRSPFLSTGSPFVPTPMDATGLYELGYRHAPLPLSSSSASIPPFSAIPIPLGVGGPGQQQHARARPLPLPLHNGQQLLPDPPKREGAATTVTDSGSVIHHPRPRPGVGVEGLVGYYDVSRETSGDDVLRDTSGDNTPPPSDDVGAGPDSQTGQETETETETEGGYDTAPSQLSEGDEPSMADPLLLSHHSPAAHPITGAEVWELELGETVKRAGVTSAGGGGSRSGVGGGGVVRTGRGRKVLAKVGGKSIEEKDEDEGKGKAEGTGGKDDEERMEGKGKAQESKKGEEEKPDERENEDAGDERKPDLWSVFDFDPPRSGQRTSALGSRDAPALDSLSRTTEQDVSNSTEHDLTALRATLATRQEALDQRELGLAARQERIEGMDESVREMQVAVGYREDAVGRREEAVGRREKEVEERVMAVGRREREVQGREEKVVELEQAVDERERAIEQRGFNLEERSKRVDKEMETRSPQLGGLNAPTLALGSNSWPITLLRSVVFRVLGDKTSSFLFSPSPLSSSNPGPSSSNPNSSSPSSSSAPPQRRPRRDWEARRDLYLSTGGRGSYLVLVGIGVCAVVLKVLVRRLTGVGMWSWLARRSSRR